MLIFWAFFFMFFLILWRLVSGWRYRAHIDDVSSDISSVTDTHTASPTQPTQLQVNHEIEEVGETDGEGAEPNNPDPSPTLSIMSIRKNNWFSWSVFKCQLMTDIGGLLVGYLSTVTGGLLAQPQYLRRISRRIYLDQMFAYENDFCVYTNQIILLISSIVTFMSVIGTIFAALCMCWGRRPVLFVGVVSTLVGLAGMTWFPHLDVEIIGMFLAGFGIGILNEVITDIYSETVPADARPAIFGWHLIFGGVLAATSNYISSYLYRWHWRFPLAVAWIFAFPILALSFFVEETPSFLIERGLIRKAKAALGALRGSDVDVEFTELVAEIQMKQSTSALVAITRPENRPALVIATMETMFGKLSGVDVIVFFGAFFLQSIGFSRHEAFLASFTIAVVQFIGKWFGDRLIQRLGRRMTFIGAYVAAITPLVWVGFFFDLNKNIHHHFEHGRATSSIAMVIVHTIGCSILSGPYGWLNKALPVDCDHIGSIYSKCLGSLATFLSNQVFLHILCELKATIFFTYAGFCLVMLCFTLLFIPETTNIAQHAMVRRVWRHHWYWQRYMIDTYVNS